MTALRLRNPYREVFDKYVMQVERSRMRWKPRSSHLFDVKASINTTIARDHLVERFAWAVPTDEAIETIAELSPVVEIGAGTGYWAWLLEQVGCEVVAFDAAPDGSIEAVGDHWTTVYPGDHRVLTEVPRLWRWSEHSLLLCWPPYSDPMALDCLRTFRGNTIAYVGEPEGGCCATDEFFAALDQGWEVVREVDLPQWPTLHDCLTIYRKVEGF